MHIAFGVKMSRRDWRLRGTGATNSSGLTFNNTGMKWGDGMEVQFIQRSIFQRIFGKPVTKKPQNDSCWSYEDGSLTINLTQAPELQQPGGALRLEGEGLPVRVLVVHGEDGHYCAYHNRCTHMGHRRLDPVPGTNTVQCCSINKSTYDENGKPIFGPAPESITRFPLEVDGDTIVISIS